MSSNHLQAKEKQNNSHNVRVSLEEAAAAGCRKCDAEYKTGEKTANSHDANCPRKGKSRGGNKKYKTGEKTAKPRGGRYDHQVTIKDAAALGCKKCMREYKTGAKTDHSHDVGCPRRRGAPGKSSSTRVSPKGALNTECKGDSSSAKPFSKTKKSTRPPAEILEEGDPPWRTKGNAWLGRRLFYKPDATKEETRSCSKNRFYDVDGIDTQHEDVASSSIKGTILGFISERDKDSLGNPAFISTRYGIPAMLFHVVFDRGNEFGLLSKDFEEWEIKEQCEWIYEESDSDDDASDDLDQHAEENEALDNTSVVFEHDTFEIEEEVKHQTASETEAKSASKSKASSVHPVKNISKKKATSDVTTSTNANSVNVLTEENKQETNHVAAGSYADENASDENEKIKVVSNAPQVEKVIKPNLSDCSSFNEALKSALSTYASSSAFKIANNPPPPVPPPFLSHQEDCTLRTALAFVMIKARNKQRQGNGSTSKGANIGNASLLSSRALTQQTPFGRSGIERRSSLNPSRNRNAELIEQPGRNSSLLGGLLSMPRRQGGRSTSASNAMLIFDREMNYIRDILQLALSSVMPLYRGALGINDEDDGPGDDPQSNQSVRNENNDANAGRNIFKRRLPSAVYDFEACYNHLSTGKGFDKSSAERHYASLDGLCQHAASRLARLINETALKIRLEQKAKKSQAPKAQEKANEKLPVNDSNEKLDAPTVFSRENHVPFPSKQIISNAVVKLFYDNIIGQAYQHELMDGNLHEDRKISSRVENIMAACHVIHRLLFFDQGLTFASECTIAISRTLADIYNSNYGFDISTENETSHFTKGKVQVVRPRWTSNRTAYSDDRNERRSRGIDFMFRDGTMLNSGGGKRKIIGPVKNEVSTSHSPPNVFDVLAVNLLRLLECVSELRLHHHTTSSQRRESSPAADIIKEIRSTNAIDLTMPIHFDEAAAFFLRESQAANNCNEPSLLRPCAKLMLHIHFFGLIKKLSAYEQV
jgi:hypothetical protein